MASADTTKTAAELLINSGMTTSTSLSTDETSIEDLQKEIERLKKRIVEERNKLCDKSVVQVSETIEPIQGLNIKVRRSLKGHNAKVLCLDWSTDKRHLVSSSQVAIFLIVEYALESIIEVYIAGWKTDCVGCVHDQQGACNHNAYNLGHGMCLWTFSECSCLWRP